MPVRMPEPRIRTGQRESPSGLFRQAQTTSSEGGPRSGFRFIAGVRQGAAAAGPSTRNVSPPLDKEGHASRETRPTKFEEVLLFLARAAEAPRF